MRMALEPSRGGVVVVSEYDELHRLDVSDGIVAPGMTTGGARTTTITLTTPRGTPNDVTMFPRPTATDGAGATRSPLSKSIPIVRGRRSLLEMQQEKDDVVATEFRDYQMYQRIITGKQQHQDPQLPPFPMATGVKKVPALYPSGTAAPRSLQEILYLQQSQLHPLLLHPSRPQQQQQHGAPFAPCGYWREDDTMVFERDDNEEHRPTQLRSPPSSAFEPYTSEEGIFDLEL